MEIVTWDPNFKGHGVSLSNANLVASFSKGNMNSVRSTHGVDKNKIYFEVDYIGPGQRFTIGVISQDYLKAADMNWCGYITSDAVTAVSGKGSFAFLYNWGPGAGYYDCLTIPIISIGSFPVPEYYSNTTIGCRVDFINKQVSWYLNNNLVTQLPKGHLRSDIYYVAIGSDTKYGSVCGGLANFGATPFKYPIPDGFISLQDAVNIPPYKKLYKKGESVYGVQNDIFTKLSDDFSALSEGEKIAIFTNTDNRYPAIEELSSLGKFKVLTYSDTSTPPPDGQTDRNPQ